MSKIPIDQYWTYMIKGLDKASWGVEGSRCKDLQGLDRDQVRSKIKCSEEVTKSSYKCQVEGKPKKYEWRCGSNRENLD